MNNLTIRSNPVTNSNSNSNNLTGVTQGDSNNKLNLREDIVSNNNLIKSMFNNHGVNRHDKCNIIGKWQEQKFELSIQNYITSSIKTDTLDKCYDEIDVISKKNNLIIKSWIKSIINIELDGYLAISPNLRIRLLDQHQEWLKKEPNDFYQKSIVTLFKNLAFFRIDETQQMLSIFGSYIPNSAIIDKYISTKGVGVKHMISKYLKNEGAYKMIAPDMLLGRKIASMTVKTVMRIDRETGKFSMAIAKSDSK